MILRIIADLLGMRGRKMLVVKLRPRQQDPPSSVASKPPTLQAPPRGTGAFPGIAWVQRAPEHSQRSRSRNLKSTHILVVSGVRHFASAQHAQPLFGHSAAQFPGTARVGERFINSVATLRAK